MSKKQKGSKIKNFSRDEEEEIIEALEEANKYDTFQDALYAGAFGTTAEGAYPGRGGKGTVTAK